MSKEAVTKARSYVLQHLQNQRKTAVRQGKTLRDNYCSMLFVTLYHLGSKGKTLHKTKCVERTREFYGSQDSIVGLFSNRNKKKRSCGKYFLVAYIPFLGKSQLYGT